MCATLPEKTNNTISANHAPPLSEKIGADSMITPSAASQSSRGKLRPLVVSTTVVGEVVTARLKRVFVTAGRAFRSAATQAETMGVA